MVTVLLLLVTVMSCVGLACTLMALSASKGGEIAWRVAVCVQLATITLLSVCVAAASRLNQGGVP